MASDIVEECKARLGIVGDYHDATIAGYAADVKRSKSYADLRKTITSDLRNTARAMQVSFSPRVVQTLRLIPPTAAIFSPCGEPFTRGGICT